MSRDPAAKWIFETERPDLVANWFKNRAFNVRQLRETAETTFWSGLDENKKTPIEILKGLSQALRSIAYLHALVDHAAKSSQQQWSSEPERYRFVHIAVTEADAAMSSDHSAVLELERLVRFLIGYTDPSFANQVTPSSTEGATSQGIEV